VPGGVAGAPRSPRGQARLRRAPGRPGSPWSPGTRTPASWPDRSRTWRAGREAPGRRSTGTRPALFTSSARCGCRPCR
jgi:hypothetical protein